ncbi:MAG: hypothetical protein AAF483_05650 [Planctomycetota bacterium]
MFLEKSTVFSLIADAANGNSTDRERAVATFFEVYSPPLIDYLCYSKKLDQTEAEDVLQSFWAERFLGEDGSSKLLAKFLEKKAREPSISMREYLGRSLSNHVNSYKRRTKGEEVSLDAIEGLEPADDFNQTDFDVSWANRLLARVFEDVRRECSDKGKLTHWKLFEEQALRPAMLNSKAPGYTVLAEKYGFRGPSKVSSAMVNMRRRFKRILEEHVADYAITESNSETESAVRAETDALLELLHRPGHMRIRAFDSDSDYSCGFELDSTDSNAVFLIEKIDAAPALFSSEQDLASAWSDLCEAPLKSWLIESTLDEESSLSDAFYRSEDATLCNEIRSVAKVRGRNRNESELPRDFYVAIYLLAIAAAQVRIGKPISTQSHASLVKRAVKTKEFSWLREQENQLLDSFCESSASKF